MIQEKLKAVFYARVSTEEEKQLNALEKQVQENIDVIKAKNWDLVDQYIDEGKSGTTTKRRNEYQRLFSDMESNKFDIIVIKSQDRLQRNTFEWYRFADHLNKTEKKLFLYMDNKFYEPSEDALITGIKAILAEEYSRDLSKKINNANRCRIEKARAGEKVNACGNGQVYGYNIVDKKWVIDENEADLVRVMFKTYTEQHSLRKTTDKLNELGYRNKTGGLFTISCVNRVLQNPTHKGWAILNRYHKDFETKKIIENPAKEWVIIKDDHEPIVSEELWDAVNNEIQSHRNAGNDKGKTKGIGKKFGTDPLSGKIYCSNCGKVMWVKYSINSYGRWAGWYCSTNTGRAKCGCNNPSNISQLKIERRLEGLADYLIENGIIEMSRKTAKAQILNRLLELRKYYATPNNNAKTKKEIEKLEEKKARLLDLYLDGGMKKKDYKDKLETIECDIEEKKELLVPIVEDKAVKSIDEAIENIDSYLDDYIDLNTREAKLDFMKAHTKRIIVLPNKDLSIELDILAGAVLSLDDGKSLISYFLEKVEDAEDGLDGNSPLFVSDAVSKSDGRGFW